MSEKICLGDQNKMTKSNRWLNEFAKDVTLQYGEDGIIEKVLDVISDNNKWCVEFGSWDGQHLSNTFNLINNKDYSTVLIEGNARRFQDLLKTYEGNGKVIPINAFVGFEKENGLDLLLEATEIPSDFDLLSIDIDGNDYHFWPAKAGAWQPVKSFTLSSLTVAIRPLSCHPR